MDEHGSGGCKSKDGRVLWDWPRLGGIALFCKVKVLKELPKVSYKDANVIMIFPSHDLITLPPQLIFPKVNTLAYLFVIYLLKPKICVLSLEV